MERPSLPGSVVILPGTPVEEAWGRFKVFEALHHLMDIMNPLSSEDLDAVIAALGVGDGSKVLDIACGHGELLLRLAGRHQIDGVGIDLSPWQIRRASERSSARHLDGTIGWWMGRGEDILEGASWDVIACIGASWIWDGFEGTVRALTSRCRPGGSIAIGDTQRRPGVSADDLSDEAGPALSREEQLQILEALGIGDLTEIVPSISAWDAYQERTRESAEAWSERHPGQESARFLAEQRGWGAEHRAITTQVAWTVWVGRVGADGG